MTQVGNIGSLNNLYPSVTSAITSPSVSNTLDLSASESAAQKAVAAQAQQQQLEAAKNVEGDQAQAFRMKPIRFARDAPTSDVLISIARSMAAPTTSEAARERLQGFHSMLLDAQKSMISAMMSG